MILVTAISVISAYAKTIKEAQTYALPVMFIAMGVGISGMFGTGASQELSVYCIPLYNSAQCMAGVFSFSITPAAVAVTAGVNLAGTPSTLPAGGRNWSENVLMLWGMLEEGRYRLHYQAGADFDTAGAAYGEFDFGFLSSLPQGQRSTGQAVHAFPQRLRQVVVPPPSGPVEPLEIRQVSVEPPEMDSVWEIPGTARLSLQHGKSCEKHPFHGTFPPVSVYLFRRRPALFCSPCLHEEVDGQHGEPGGDAD